MALSNGLPAALAPVRQSEQRTRRTHTYRMLDSDVLHSDAPASSEYVLRVRDMAESDRPRERMARLGSGELSLAEIVAVLLGSGTRREEVMSMSRRILREYGERTIMSETDPARLSEALDIPLAKACQLLAGLELGRRFYQTRGGKPTVIRTAAQAYEYLFAMAQLPKEQLRALYLGGRYQLVHEEIISVGSLTANIVHPREIFQPAIVYGAAAIIVAHNHPSGSLEPTPSDRLVTRQLVASGEMLGIELLDHLIIAGESYSSIMQSEQPE